MLRCGAEAFAGRGLGGASADTSYARSGRRWRYACGNVAHVASGLSAASLSLLVMAASASGCSSSATSSPRGSTTDASREAYAETGAEADADLDARAMDATEGGSDSPSPKNPFCPTKTNTVVFQGTDATTQGAWKGPGNFNASPASPTLTYGKDGDILPDTEGCDTGCNLFPSYVSFGPECVGASTPGNIGGKPYAAHAYVAMLQGPANVMGAEPQNSTNTDYFQCNYTLSNPAAPWAPMVAWRPTTDTREISQWYTCSGITSFYLELSFGDTTHNFEVYVVDDQNGDTRLRSEQIQMLDGDTDAVLFDSGSFTSFTSGVYYKWTITGHVKINVINTSTNGTSAVINGAFFD
jgi:hypothetical protein